jgi:hypothetical protein
VWLQVKLQVEAPLEKLQRLQGGFSFRSFKKIEANFDGWSEATLEAAMKPCFEAYPDCPYYKWLYIILNGFRSIINGCKSIENNHK